MRVAINLEFTDEELRKYAADVGRRWVLDAIHDGVRHINALKLHPSVASVLAQAAAQAFTKPESPQEPRIDAEFTEPPQTRQASNGPCVRMDANDHLDEGWLCHVCATYNGMQRMGCRNCAHERCDVIVTPPPAERTSESIYTEIRGQPDLLLKYETLIRFWPANTIDIWVTSPSGADTVVASHPKSASELYEVLKAIHGENEEAEYRVRFFDAHRKEMRAVGRITMPDTRVVQ